MSIILDHVNYVYGADTPLAVHALNDVCLKIPDGQFIGIIGHTGSGKSTLMQHMNGLIRATDGHIYFNGEDIYDKDYDMKKLRSKVGLVFQYPEHQLFEVDVLTDVCFGPKNQGLSKEECEKRAKEALELVGFPEELYYSLRLSFPEDRREGRRLREFLPCARKYWYWMNRLPDWIREDGMRFWIRLQSFTRKRESLLFWYLTVWKISRNMWIELL